MSDAENDGKEGTDIAIQEAPPQLAEPPRFVVWLLNDDYTTMEFVIEVLMKFFKKTQEQAMEIMLKVHQQGRGVAGIYSYEIAETKVSQVTDYAKAKGFPLKCELEPMGKGFKS
jgi:ATP-dependent Clp protease adaptor protein ClpS